MNFANCIASGVKCQGGSTISGLVHAETIVEGKGQVAETGRASVE